MAGAPLHRGAGGTHAQLLSIGVEVIVNTSVAGFADGLLTLARVFSSKTSVCDADALMLVTSREPDETLYRELVGEDPTQTATTVQAIGDCLRPALIANAVYARHRAGRELGGARPDDGRARDRPVV